MSGSSLPRWRRIARRVTISLFLAPLAVPLLSTAPAHAAGNAPGQIVGSYNGRCLDADGSGTRDRLGAIVQMWDCNNNAWQKWVLTRDGQIKSRYNGRCLDADGSGTRDRLGAIVQMWDCNNNAWQKWNIGSDGRIYSRYNGRCLDADRNATKSLQGALVQLWDCNSNSWQRWSNSFHQLSAGQALGPDEMLLGGAYSLIMQGDGNLVIYGPNGPEWATATRQPPARLEMQHDGNLVIYGPNGPQWSTGTSGGNLRLAMQADDGNLVIYDGGVAKWASKSSSSGAALAGRLLTTSGIDLYDQHLFGRPRDASTARGNINDTANNRPAKTSSWSDVGVRDVTLNTRMLEAMLKLRAEKGYTFRVVLIAGGDHSANSRHYRGVAFDVDFINGSTVLSGKSPAGDFLAACRQYGATELLGPGDPDHNDHVHCAW